MKFIRWYSNENVFLLIQHFNQTTEPVWDVCFGGQWQVWVGRVPLEALRPQIQPAKSCLLHSSVCLEQQVFVIPPVSFYGKYLNESNLLVFRYKWLYSNHCCYSVKTKLWL